MTVARLVASASNPYRAAGRFAYHFARGKLSHDPLFEAILSDGLLAGRSNILDLGCGQGLLAAWLMAARDCARGSEWPRQWPEPPQPEHIRGIELAHRPVERARRALGNVARFDEADVRSADFGCADGVVIIDVLHYIEYPDQRRILERVRKTLIADGVLLLRVSDAAAGFEFRVGKYVDQAILLLKQRALTRLYCRSTAQWRDLLSATGFDCKTRPMAAGTPFANVLFVATPQ